jgi:hypothetical protein
VSRHAYSSSAWPLSEGRGRDLRRHAAGADVDLIGAVVAQEARVAGGEGLPNPLAVVVFQLQIGLEGFSAVDALVSVSSDICFRSLQMPSAQRIGGVANSCGYGGPPLDRCPRQRRRPERPAARSNEKSGRWPAVFRWRSPPPPPSPAFSGLRRRTCAVNHSPSPSQNVDTRRPTFFACSDPGRWLAVIQCCTHHTPLDAMRGTKQPLGVWKGGQGARTWQIGSRGGTVHAVSGSGDVARG